MPIFYLAPREESSADPRWEATSLKEGCWVEARTAEEARLKVEMATIAMVDFVPGRPKLYSPWRDQTLTDCRSDNPSLEIPEGAIVTVTGRTIS
jgi:hypothetical protein